MPGSTQEDPCCEGVATKPVLCSAGCDTQHSYSSVIQWHYPWCLLTQMLLRIPLSHINVTTSSRSSRACTVLSLLPSLHSPLLVPPHHRCVRITQCIVCANKVKVTHGGHKQRTREDAAHVMWLCTSIVGCSICRMSLRRKNRSSPKRD
jgi:hypothetical protein